MDPLSSLVVDAVADACETVLLANLSENHLKVAVLGRLLTAGCEVLEGSNRPGLGRRLAYDPARGITCRYESLPSMPAPEGSGKARLSPDIRVVAPARLVVELQARSIFGTQSALASANLIDDVHRVATRTADLFVLAADRPLYDALRGEKTETRGRKALSPQLWRALLPASAGVSRDQTAHAAHIGTEAYTVHATRRASRAGVERIVVGVKRANAA